MKKIFFALVIFMLALQVEASSTNIIENEIAQFGFYKNAMGVEINKENYDKIKNFLTEEEIKNIPQGNFELLTKHGEIIQKETQYYETKNYTDALGNNFTTTNEITKEEYDLSTPINSRATTHSTNYKTISITQTSNSNSKVYFIIQVSWKKMPEHRSFDVLAFRTDSNTIIYTFESYQDYVVDGTAGDIYYTSSSNNYKEFTKGAGISQNLVNNSTYYYHTLAATVSCSAGKIYGSYQHAQGSLTLAQSKSYTLSSTGYGGVIKFTDSTALSTYDKMGGISLTPIC